MNFPMLENKDFKYWDELCESFEAACGVARAKSILVLPFDVNEWDGLGGYYEKNVTKQHKAKYGQFFTPKSIVEYLIKSTRHKNTHTVADISCGSGRFLLGVIEKLVASRIELSQIQNRVFGLDIDPILVRIAVANIRGYLARSGYAITLSTIFNVECRNSLDNVGGLFSTKSEFDCILGNPPYLKASPGKNLGHPNLYASFVEAGISFLRKGGRLGYIIPKSFVSGAYFSRLRQILADQVLTEEIVTIYERDHAFSDVLQEQVLLTVNKTAPTCKDVKVGVAFTNGKFEISTFRSPYSTVFWEDIICIPSNQFDMQLVNKCFKNGFKKIAHAGLRVSTGQIVPFRMREYLTGEDKSSHRPIYWSHNIVANKFEPNKKQKGRQHMVIDCKEIENEKLRGPVLAFKRISAKEQSRRLEGALIPGNSRGYFLENHLNFIKREHEKAPSLEVLRILLNSALWDRLFRLINGNTQVSAKEIRIFPIPHNVDLLEGIAKKGVHYHEELEKAVNTAYGLTSEESNYVLSGRNEIM